MQVNWRFRWVTEGCLMRLNPGHWHITEHNKLFNLYRVVRPEPTNSEDENENE